jgi:N6-adenosine-specific RNA methylase IME4
MNYEPTDKRGQKKQSIDQLTRPDFPTGNYSVIVADPPWRYKLRETDKTHRGRTPYPTMSDQEILDLPIEKIASVDSYLLLWTTNNFLPLGLSAMKAWGFEYKAIHTWVKITKAGKPHIGIGHYGRNCTEQVLIGMRGKPGSWTSLTIRDVPNVMIERRSEHSRKPEAFDKTCDRLLAAMGGTGIELFARRQRARWDCWGLEAG